MASPVNKWTSRIRSYVVQDCGASRRLQPVRSMRRHVGILCLGALAAACDGQPPAPLAENVRTVTVCEALTQPIGQRIRVRGEFGGFTYDTASATFSMSSPGVCTSEGAGVVWVELSDTSEREKVFRLRPRNDRARRAGDSVTVEGQVAADNHERSIRLLRATVSP